MFDDSKVEAEPRPWQFGLNRIQILQSQQTRNDADSPTVTTGLGYPAAKVPLVTEASHWLTGGPYMLYESLLPCICS